MAQPSSRAGLEADLLALPDPVPPGTYATLAATHGCSVKVIRNRMHRLRVEQRTSARCAGHRPWTPAEQDRLTTGWPTLPIPTLARSLQRSELAILQRIIQTGVVDSTNG